MINIAKAVDVTSQAGAFSTLIRPPVGAVDSVVSFTPTGAATFGGKKRGSGRPAPRRRAGSRAHVCGESGEGEAEADTVIEDVEIRLPPGCPDARFVANLLDGRFLITCQNHEFVVPIDNPDLQ